MAKRINVLVFPAGEVNSVELHDALSTCVNVEVYGASSVERHGPFVFKNYIPDVPFISDEAFIGEFNAMIKKYAIDVIFPTHDTVAEYLVEHQEEINAKVVGGDLKTVKTCRDKKKTYELFADCAFVPKLYASSEGVVLPVFRKPSIGQGSVGARRIETLEELQTINFDTEVVAEYLPGDELTVDCLTDKQGKLVVVSPRTRERTMAGISVRTRSSAVSEKIQEMAATINERLQFCGLWYFQVRNDAQGLPKLLEVSCRVAGAMCLTRARGINLPLMSVYTALGYDVAAIPNDYEIVADRTLISRYKIDYDYDTVYLDFDDTVIVNGAVNHYAVMYLYQCKAKDIAVHLITRHEHDIRDTLKRFCLDEGLFMSIIQLDFEVSKNAHIKPEKAIFIDNAFSERQQVRDTYNIPVFDVDGIEVLLDWRS